jgi:hypothetical protein
LIGSGPGAARVRYDLLFLFAYALAFGAAWFLARQLGLGRFGAFACAAAFAYAPWRASQAGHLHILSSGGIPLTFGLLLAGFRRRAPWLVAAGFAVAAWQVALGFSLGLQLLYALIPLVPLIAWQSWLRHVGLSNALRERGLVLATAGGALGLAAVALALALPYLQVRHDHPESARTPGAIAALSPRPLSYLAAPAENVAWGYRTATVRNHLYARGGFAPADEKTLFPGLVAVVLAIVGIARAPLARGLRVGLGVATVVLALLALGTSLGAASPYRLLYDLAPGWDSIRTPGRLETLLTLSIALLAGGGAQHLLSVAARRRGMAARLVPLLPLLILFEGWSPPAVVSVRAEPAGFASAKPPVLYLPSDRFTDSLYMYWSTDGFAPIANGWSGFEPVTLTRLRQATASFPKIDRRVLVKAGVRSVAVDSPGRPLRVYTIGAR